MKRLAVIKKIRQGTRRADVDVEMYELTRHTGIHCGDVATTIPRHSEIADQLAEAIFRQLAPALGERWWTK
ncbi:MAG: hypothetical protein ACRDQI_17270 [Pseudonocardiaceae bacterium]